MTLRGAPQANDGDMDLIVEYLEHLRRAGRAASTLAGRSDILRRLNRTLPYGVGQTSTNELADWLQRDTWAQNTRHTYFLCLRSFYDWAASGEKPMLSFDPARGLEPVGKAKSGARPVSDVELHKILTQAAEPIRTWATIAAYQGLRCVEISRLDRQHVTERQLIVVKGKGGWPRAHDTDPYVWDAVKDLPPGPVARTPDGQRAGPWQVSATAAAHFHRDLGMPTVTMHRLRHWLGVTLQREYRDIRVTQAALGHRSLQSTQIYTDATEDQQRAARATLPRLAG